MGSPKGIVWARMTSTSKTENGRTLGLINARGGSKGVPRKNVRPLAGLPLISHTIESALNSGLSDVIVSTEDPEIASVSVAAGAEAPFRRPANLASDSASQLDVILHAIIALRTAGRTYDKVVLLQPVCPFRSPEDIDLALSMLDDSRVGSVISVSNAESFHPMTMYVSKNNRLVPLLRQSKFGTRRQDFPEVWWRNGLIYAFRPDDFIQAQTLEIEPVLPLEIPIERAVNIDNELDWSLAEILAQAVGVAPSPEEHH